MTHSVAGVQSSELSVAETFIKQRQCIGRAGAAKVNRLGWPLAGATHCTSLG